jgi:hypothetical protein
MSITINGATNTLTAASGLAIAGNTAVTGTLSVSSTLTASLNTTNSAIFGNTTDNNGLFIRIYGSSTSYNWALANNYFAAGRLDFVPSTAVGGTTFTTPVVSMSTTGLAVTGTLSANGLGTFSSGLFTDSGALQIGADIGAASITNATRKFGAITAPHYTNAQEKVAALSVDSDAATTLLNIGGGSSSFNSPTGISFYTQAAVDTGGGSVVGTFSSTGLAVTGTLSASGDSNKFGTGGAADSTLQIGPDAPAAARSGRIAFTTNASVKNWFIASNWLTQGTLDIVQSTANGGTTMAGSAIASFSSTALTLGTGVNLVMASGQGIDFSATANGSGTTTSEVLSDYEEGTWTPVLTSATPGDLSVTYSAQLGTYTKVGRSVTVTFNVATSAFTHTTASGGAMITGLPFTSGATYTAYGSGMLNGLTKTGYTDFSYEVSPTNTRFLVACSGSAVAQANAVIGNFPTGGAVYLYGTITYQV